METNNQKNDQNIIPNDADKQQKGVNVPNLRFSQFVENWVKVNIKDILKILYGKDYKDQGAGNIPVYGTGGIMCYINNYLCNWNCVCIGRKGTINKPIYIDQPFWCVDTLFYSKAKNNNSPKFQYYLFQTINWDKLNEASGVPSLSSSTIENIKIFIPNTDEQKRIADFLSLIDQRIDTQNKIIEDLQTLKFSICDKVFEDRTYPEYKLKDVLSERIEKSNVNNQYKILSSTIKGLFTQKEYFDKDIASSNNIGYKIVHLYDIIISPQNLWMGNITFNQRFSNGLVSPSYKIYTINNNFDMYYIANMLKTKRAMYKYICSSQQGASVVRRNLNMDDFLSLSFNIPDINKQRKIGLLLNTIDKKIDLEQTYLTKLNQQKKFLLKNMFI